jgi:hypothetical protein
MRKYLFGLFGLAALAAAGFAWAQGIIPLASPVGTELLTVYPLSPTGGLGGGQAQVNFNQIRNTSGTLLVGAGTTVNTTVPNSAGKVITTGAISTAWNVTLPTAPGDGQTVALACTGGAAAAVTVAATLPAGVGLVGTAFSGATCAAGGAAAAGVEYVYVLSTNTWYRIQ